MSETTCIRCERPMPDQAYALMSRFEESVVRNEGGCWSWTGATNSRGYGRIGVLYVHRISWEIHWGAISDGLWVLHRCDNPPCTNPDHLFLGTHADNMADAASKGRLNGRPNRPVREANPASKLTAEQVHEIRQLRAAGVKQRDVAARFGVSQSLIGQIATGKIWRSV